MQPSIIYENENFIILNKPAGMPVHVGGSVKKGEALTDWLIKKFPTIKNVGDDPLVRPGIVHRLDKETSGVMVVARNQQSFEELKRLFQKRQMTKEYLALVSGRIEKNLGVIALPIGAPKTRGVKRTVQIGHARLMKEAITEFKVLERFRDATLILAKPKTGRMHQIRVHCAAIGHPVIGDRLYGKKTSISLGLSRQFLHASSLTFSYPEGKRFSFAASLPFDLRHALQRLRKAR